MEQPGSQAEEETCPRTAQNKNTSFIGLAIWWAASSSTRHYVCVDRERERDQIMYFTILMHWLLLLWCWMTTMNDNDTRKARYDNAPAIKYNWNRLKWMRRKTNANFYYYYSIYKFPNQGKNKMEGAAAHKFSPLALGQSVVGWGL